MTYALITGAAKRIGKSIAIFLAKQGWDIVIHYNKSYNEAVKLQRVIERTNQKCILYQSNFSKLENNNCFNHRIPLGIIVNNASDFKVDYLDNLNYKNFFNILKVNFITPMLLTQIVLSNSTYQKQINIINILDSIIYKLPSKFISYYFSKYMLANFTKVSAKLHAPKLRVNGIALGHILKNKKQSLHHFQKCSKKSILGYNGSIKEICNTIDFILNNRSITGQIISLDGGSHLDNFYYP